MNLGAPLDRYLSLDSERVRPMKSPLPYLCLVLAACFAGCENSDADVKIFNVRGVVQELSVEDPTKIIIDHEEMPGYMAAMIMPFQAKDPDELDGLTPGDVVTFNYHVATLESWITDVAATGETGEIKSLDDLGEPAAPLLAEGDLLPDYEFLDENGEPIKLSELRGMPVALTFVFSRCPVPEYCPRMMRNFFDVHNQLEADPDAPEDFRLLTISFDSWNDTPEIMKNWGKAYGHQPGQKWSLLTSETCCTISEIGANVGLKFGEVNGSYNHNLRTVVLDPDGTIRRIFTDETWSTDELIAEIKAAASS